MAHYLPVLLGSVSANAAPDDSALTALTLARGQVDYLSHDWQEEDVARSWRSMTRNKNEIANGMRLENASWRTWWKQRNKLKTVTPETLNWLKDSDVTWLYGPLHTAVDHSPPLKLLPGTYPPTSTSSAHDPLDLSSTCPKKPILKHRSISELLTSELPSPLFSPADSDEEPVDRDGAVPKRPQLLHTKSDTHIAHFRSHRSFGRDAPLKVISNGSIGHDPTLSSVSTNGRSSSVTNSIIRSSASEQDLTPLGNMHRTVKKKRISFNPCVEQYIAIEKPKPWSVRRRSIGMRGSYDLRRGRVATIEQEVLDDGYDEDAEDDDDEVELWGGPSKWDSGSEDDEVDELDCNGIEMRSCISAVSHRSSSTASTSTASTSSSSASGSRPPHRRNHGGRYMPSSIRSASSDAPMTIAPLAPTTLKTSDVYLVDGFGERDDNASDDGLGRWLGDGTKGAAANMRSLDSSSASARRQLVQPVYGPTSGSVYDVPMDVGEAEEEQFYLHRDTYLGLGIQHSPSLGVIPPSPSAPRYFRQATVASSQPVLDAERDEDAYDYFGGPDLGEDYARSRGHAARRRRDLGTRAPGYAEGGAASAVGGQNSGKGKSPEVVVSDEDRRGRDVATRSGSTSRSRSDERSRSRSRSRTPSPLFSTPPSSQSSRMPSIGPVPVPGSGNDRSPPHATALLSPPTRGRSSTPTEVREARGRSTARGSSSLSDRERSGTRNGHSPMGSLSPDGSGSTIGTACAVIAGGRKMVGERTRTGRRPSESLGYDSPKIEFSDGGLESSRDRSTSPLSGSSTSSNPSTLVPSYARSSQDDFHPDRSEPSISIPDAATKTCQEEEEERRSYHPTPTNSPTVFKPLSLPRLDSLSRPLDPSRGLTESPIKSSTFAPGLGGGAEQHGTLVGRAVDIVLSAGAFIGSMWHAGAA